MENDTVKLLRECDAGIKMGVGAIDDVIEHVKDERFRKLLAECKKDHEVLREELDRMLVAKKDDGKEPNPMAKGMSWLKTNMKMAAKPTDETVADLITDGCNMGVKSLHRYLNLYGAADESSRDLAKRLINTEERLAVDIRSYL